MTIITYGWCQIHKVHTLSMTRVGLRIDNYTLTRQLGTNAFGPVWAARESITERMVSINILTSSDDYEVARFTRAISLLSRLNHANIAVHTGHGFVGHSPYLATEYLHGPTLATLMAQGGRMDERKVLQIAVQVAAALDHAWEKAAVIHRNLGPQTIVVDLTSLQSEHESLVIRIIDFGHALGKRLIDTYDPEAVAEEAAFQQAANQEVVGSPMTMSPEQAAGARLTVASDMYALGVTMYLLLTGVAPFTGSDDEVKASHQRVQALDLRSLVPGIQPLTATLVKRLLSKTAVSRFSDWDACRLKINEALEPLERRRQPPPVMTPTAARRKTQTFEKTPVGQPIPMGADTAGPAVPLSMPPSYQPSQPGGLSADDVRLLATHAAHLRRSGASAPLATPNDLVPAVDDGLTAEQRMAMWVRLFRSPAIADASLTKEVSHESVPVHEVAPAPLRSDSSDDLSDLLVEVPEVTVIDEPQPEFQSQVQSFADLFAEATPRVIPDAGDQVDEDGVPLRPDVPGNPLQSRFWKNVLEVLRDSILGTVRYETAPQHSLTRRVTRSFLSLVAGREPTRDEILAMILCGKFDQAEIHLNKIALSIKRDNTSGLDDGVCLLRAKLMGLRGDFPNALGWAQQAIRLNSSDPAALALVGVAHLQLRRVQTSISVFDEVAKLYPQSPLGPLGQGAVLFLGGLERKADLALAEASHREDHPAIIRLQALRCRAHGDAEGEVAYLQQLLTGTGADWAIQERLREIAGG